MRNFNGSFRSYLMSMLDIEWQIINVYNQEYESAAAFWPNVHGRIIFALVISQLLLLGLLSTKEAANSTPLLIVLPVLTIWFHLFCKGRYEPAFIRHPLQVIYYNCFSLIAMSTLILGFLWHLSSTTIPLSNSCGVCELQEAMMKDTLERAREPNFNLKEFLQNAYIHPVFKGDEDDDSDVMSEEWEQEPVRVQTRRTSRRNTPLPSKHSGSLSPSSKSLHCWCPFIP